MLIASRDRALAWIDDNDYWTRIGGAACPVTMSQKLSIVSHAFVATSAPKGTLTTELVAKDTSAAKNILLDIQVIVTMD